MKTAKEIMTKDIVVVNPDTPISLAIRLLSIRKITGLPVVDESRNLIGIISELDLMTLLRDNADFVNKTVEDFMTKEVKFFSPDDSVMDICEFLLEHTFRRVPIVENGKLVGVISRSDIIHLIHGEKF